MAQNLLGRTKKMNKDANRDQQAKYRPVTSFNLLFAGIIIQKGSVKVCKVIDSSHHNYAGHSPLTNVLAYLAHREGWTMPIKSTL